MDEKSLIFEVRQYLQNKKYLIFFDAVWREDFCDQVELAMPNNNESSRIIITTIVMHVAEFFKKSFPVHVHNLQRLPPDKAWELFCKKAFRFELDGKCPAELESDESATNGITRRLSVDTSSYYVFKSSNNAHIRAIHAYGKGLLEPFMDQLSSKSGFRKYLTLKVDHGGLDLIQGMRMLRQLRKLGLRRVRMEHGNAICSLVVKMDHLESLNITVICEDEIVDLNSISSLPQLRQLKLKARLEKMPNWIPKLEFLIKIRLGLSNLKDDPLRLLENLPNLLKLSIWDNAYHGEVLYFQSGGFPKLKKLNLARLNRVNSILIDDGTLPSLEFFKLAEIPHLKKVSSGINDSDKLKFLDFLDIPTEFVESIDPQNGKDYLITNHVSLVFIRQWIGPKLKDFEVRTIHSSSKES